MPIIEGCAVTQHIGILRIASRSCWARSVGRCRTAGPLQLISHRVGRIARLLQLTGRPSPGSGLNGSILMALADEDDLGGLYDVQEPAAVVDAAVPAPAIDVPATEDDADLALALYGEVVEPGCPASEPERAAPPGGFRHELLHGARRPASRPACSRSSRPPHPAPPLQPPAWFLSPRPRAQHPCPPERRPWARRRPWCTPRRPPRRRTAAKGSMATC